MAERGKRGRCYTPPTVIHEVPGLARSARNDLADEYIGSAEAIVASGLVRADQLPGQPGLPLTVVTYRPEGTTRADGYYHSLPGYIQISRRLDGQLRVVFNVDAEERTRREAVTQQREDEADAAEEAVLAELPARVREYIEKASNALGGRLCVRQLFRNAKWLEDHEVSPRARDEVLNALKVFDRAADERRMVLHPRRAMSEALVAIDRIARDASAGVRHG